MPLLCAGDLKAFHAHWKTTLPSAQPKDEETIGFYSSEAVAYTSKGAQANERHLQAFMDRLPKGGSVLELGCGAGQDSEVMLAKGFDVTPTDGTPEIAAAAEKRLGRPVQVLLFGDLHEHDRFDGIWANACLLHVPRSDLPSIITRVHSALRPGGAFYASFKTGQVEGRDRFGRYYNYPTAEWLVDVYKSERWRGMEIAKEAGSGYDGVPTDWLHVLATKAA